MNPHYKITCIMRSDGPMWFVYDANGYDRDNDPHRFQAWNARLFASKDLNECDAWIDRDRAERRAQLDGEAA